MSVKKQLDELSWTELRETVKKVDTILIPVGSVEEEGPHLPLGVDSIVAWEVTRRVAQEAEVLVAPLVPIGYSGWHSGFPGTLSLSIDTLTQLLREICKGLVEHGFKKLLFINSHVGNETPILVVGTELRKVSGATIGMVSLWALANEMCKDIEGLDERVFLHAGEIMTSVMLALRPDLVDMGQAKAEHPISEAGSLIRKGSQKVQFRNYHANIYSLSNEVTKSGVMGNPLGATKGKGELIIERWIDYIRSFIKEFKKLPAPH